MKVQSIGILMIIIVTNFSSITTTITKTTIGNEVTTSSSQRTGKQLIDQLAENGTLDLIPGKEMIKLLDPPTRGLISSIIHSMEDLKFHKLAALIGLSSFDLLKLIETQSNGLLSSTLNGLNESTLLTSLDRLKANWPSQCESVKSKRAGPDSMSGWTVGTSKRRARSVPEEPVKRNFDEIDRSGFVGFNGKRNFDEIDRSEFRGFRGRRNFDEIDRTGLSGFSSGKRGLNKFYLRSMASSPQGNGYAYYLITSSPSQSMRHPLNEVPEKRNFDEIDRTSFTGFRGRRNFDEIDSSGFTGFYKRNFDEIDNSGFTGFVGKRSNFDEIDRSAFNRLAKRQGPVNRGQLMVTLNNEKSLNDNSLLTNRNNNNHNSISREIKA